MNHHGGGLRLVSSIPLCERRILESANPDFVLFGLESGPRVIAPDELERGGAVLEASCLAADLPVDRTIGLYCRLSAPTPDGDLPDPSALDALAEAMLCVANSANDKPKTLLLSAPYTYFGQFIAHEVSLMLAPTGGGRWENRRQGPLDLDSLLGDEPDRVTERAVWRGGVGVGQTTPFSASPADRHYADLPRSSDGRAQIRDARSDHNLALAQIHMQIAKFHHVVAAVCPGEPEDHRRVTRQHIQSIVLYDFLKRLVDPLTWRDVIDNGRVVVYPQGMPQGSEFMLPIEFAAAAFRFGHAMVRDLYPTWGGVPGDAGSLWEFLGFTKDGGRIGRPDYALPRKWVADWQGMLEGDANHLPAHAIDEVLAERLFRLRGWLLEPLERKRFATGEDRFSLARLTLSRGHELKLPTGQRLAEEVNVALRSDGRLTFSPLHPEEIGDVGNESLAAAIACHGFERATPLWFYVLREAAHGASGQHLGPLASRIVMETLHAAIEAAPDSILSEEGRRFGVAEELGFGAAREFTLSMMFKTVACLWQPSNTPQ